MITIDEVVQGYVNLILRAERAEMRVKELEAQLSKPSASQEVPVEAKKD